MRHSWDWITTDKIVTPPPQPQPHWSHKSINNIHKQKTQAHRGRAQQNGHICCLFFPPSNLDFEAKRQAATLHHRKLITAFNVLFKWTRLICVLFVGFEVFSPTGHTASNNATVSSSLPASFNWRYGGEKVNIYPCGNEASDAVNWIQGWSTSSCSLSIISHRYCCARPGG